MKKIAINILTLLLTVVSILSVFVLPAFADESVADIPTETTNHFVFNEMKTAPDNTGYAAPCALGAGDPLLGVNVLDIEIGGFSATTLHNGERVFLKTSPSVPTLSINVKADLNNLGGSGAYVCADIATVASDFGYRGRVGKGLLIVEHIDYTGKKQTFATPDLFTVLNDNGDIIPAVFGAEGHYRIAVLFETERYVKTVKEWVSPFKKKKKKIFAYNNYVISAEFSILNGNAMVFAFDSAGNEIYNGSVVSDGFFLDLAESHYLDLQIKKEVVRSSGFLGETTDTRFNTVGEDKRFYNQNGLYTITVTNPVTGATTTKKILVAGDGDTELKNTVATTHAEDFPELASALASESTKNKSEETANDTYLTAESDTANYGIKLVLIIFVASAALVCLVAGAVILIRKVS